MLAKVNSVNIQRPMYGHVDMTNAEYQAADAVSKSQLDLVAESERKYWYRYVNPLRKPRKETLAFLLGSAIHSAVLEPDDFPLVYVGEPEGAPNRPTKAQLKAEKKSDAALKSIGFWTEFDQRHAGKTILTLDQMETALGCRDAVLQHKEARKLLHRGASERSYFGMDPETGARIKARLDWDDLANGRVMDVKSTEDASKEGFRRSIMSYRYHVQQAWYEDVVGAALDDWKPLDWTFLAIEKAPPHEIGLWKIERDMVRAARRLAHRDLRTILRCRKSGVWRDAGHAGPQEIVASPYERRVLGMDDPEMDLED